MPAITLTCALRADYKLSQYAASHRGAGRVNWGRSKRFEGRQWCNIAALSYHEYTQGTHALQEVGDLLAQPARKPWCVIFSLPTSVALLKWPRWLKGCLKLEAASELELKASREGFGFQQAASVAHARRKAWFTCVAPAKCAYNPGRFARMHKLTQWTHPRLLQGPRSEPRGAAARLPAWQYSQSL